MNTIFTPHLVSLKVRPSKNDTKNEQSLEGFISGLLSSYQKPLIGTQKLIVSQQLKTIIDNIIENGEDMEHVTKEDIIVHNYVRMDRIYALDKDMQIVEFVVIGI